MLPKSKTVVVNATANATKRCNRVIVAIVRSSFPHRFEFGLAYPAKQFPHTERSSPLPRVHLVGRPQGDLGAGAVAGIGFGADEHQPVPRDAVAPSGDEEAVPRAPVLGDPEAAREYLDQDARGALET